MKKKNRKLCHLVQLTSCWKRCVQFHVEIEREPCICFAAICDRQTHTFLLAELAWSWCHFHVSSRQRSSVSAFNCNRCTFSNRSAIVCVRACVCIENHFCHFKLNIVLIFVVFFFVLPSNIWLATFPNTIQDWRIIVFFRRMPDNQTDLKVLECDLI